LILAGELDNVGPAALCKMKMPSGKTANEVILKIYPGVSHAFDWEGANPKALADSIVQVKEFLAKHLK
jgi:dienelactone hydrolase